MDEPPTDARRGNNRDRRPGREERPPRDGKTVARSAGGKQPAPTTPGASASQRPRRSEAQTKKVPVAARQQAPEPSPEEGPPRPRRLATSAAAKAPSTPPPRQVVREERAAPPGPPRGRRSALPQRERDDGAPDAKPRRAQQQPPPQDDVAPGEPRSRPPQQRAAVPVEAKQPTQPAAPIEESAPHQSVSPPRTRALVDEPDRDAIVEDGPIVSPQTVVGRGLTIVIAIMTFLCAVLFGSAMIVDRAADDWGSQVLEDISVTVLPLDGDPVERRLEDVVEALSAVPGLTDIAVLSLSQSEALLEPFLGSGTDLSLLPVPRLVSAQRANGFDAHVAADALAAIPGVSLDDHSGWSAQLSAMAGSVTAAAVAGLVLMLISTAIAVVFATRATIASNAAIVDVLHLLGAEDSFIQRAFRRRFVAIGARGAALGLAVALVLFGTLEVWSLFSAGAASAQSAALLGAPRIGAAGFLGLFVVALFVVALVGLCTHLAVRHHLKHLSL
ncbi:MAG: hypothetical protein AAGB11_15330 [Pseudomonadota bacterium]